MSPRNVDLLGQALWEYYQGANHAPLVYTDGKQEKEEDLNHYFRELTQSERELLDHAHGRVVDIGAGAGQCSLYLQDNDYEVIALDKSPGAVQLCQDRGVEHCLCMDLQAIGLRESITDTAIVLGGHLSGAIDSVVGLKTRLTELARFVRPNGYLLADLLNPRSLLAQFHMGYCELPEDGLAKKQFWAEYDGEREPMTSMMVAPDRLREVIATTPWKEQDLQLEQVGEVPIDYYRIIMKRM